MERLLVLDFRSLETLASVYSVAKNAYFVKVQQSSGKLRKAH